MLTTGIEACTNQSANTSNQNKEGEFPNRKVNHSISNGSKFTKRKELINIGLSEFDILITDGKECAKCDHGAEEGTPGEFGGPIGCSLLEREENSPDGRSEGGCYSGGGSAGNKVCVWLISGMVELIYYR